MQIKRLMLAGESPLLTKKAKRLKILKGNIVDDFEVESYDDYKLIQDGRSYEKQDLIIQ